MHLLFDLDGTLVDARPGILRALSSAVRRECPGIDPTDLDFQIGPPVREALQRALPDASPSLLNRLVASFREEYDRDAWLDTTLYPDVSRTLADLRRLGHACYLVTNKPAMPTSLILRHTGLSLFFCETLSLDPLKSPQMSKADLIRQLLRQCSIHAAEALLVGDTIDDWHAAEASGVQFAGVAYGYGGLVPASSCFPVVSAFSELPSLILQLASPPAQSGSQA